MVMTMRVGLGVAQNARHGNRLDGVRLGLQEFTLLVGFMLQGVLGGDAQNVAVNFLGQAIVAQHDVQALIPGHFVENQRHGSVNRRIEHHVQSADFVNQAEEILQVDVLEVHRNRVTRIFLFHRRSGRRLGIRGRRPGFAAGLPERPVQRPDAPSLRHFR